MIPHIYCPKSGALVHLQKPDPASIHLIDIAYNLSNLVRYSGTTRLSPAQHSLNVAAMLPKRLHLEGALHDANEAYIVEVPAPLKPLLRGYQALEEGFDDVVRDVFHLSDDPSDWTLVRRADVEARQEEMYWLLPDHPLRDQDYVPKHLRMKPLPRRIVEGAFFEVVTRLCHQRGFSPP